MKIKLFLAVATLSAILSSCKKQDIETTPLASLLVTNSVSGGGNLVLGSNAAPVYNNYFQAYGIIAGNKEVKLVDTAGGLNKVYYNQTKDFVNGGIYSLFLGGTPTAIDAVFLKEESIPSHTADVFGVRVINLVTGGVPISVNLVGAANGSFVSSLAYKSVSDFKDVSSKAAEGDKVFEFRNAATGTLITSFTVPGYDLPRFRNITLLLCSTVGTEVVLRVNNF